MPQMGLGFVEYFNSAHKVAEGPLHGHTFKVEVVIEGEYGDGSMDFHKVRPEVSNVIKTLDRCVLNDTLEVPVVENVARYVNDKLNSSFKVRSVRVWETSDRFCELVGD